MTPGVDNFEPQSTTYGVCQERTHAHVVQSAVGSWSTEADATAISERHGPLVMPEGTHADGHASGRGTSSAIRSVRCARTATGHSLPRSTTSTTTHATTRRPTCRQRVPVVTEASQGGTHMVRVTLTGGPFDGREVDVPKWMKILGLPWFSEQVGGWHRVEYVRQPNGMWVHDGR